VAQPLWYVMDEFGSRIQHSDNPNIRLVPFCYVPTKAAFTVMWPVTDIEDGGISYVDCYTDTDVEYIIFYLFYAKPNKRWRTSFLSSNISFI